MDNLTAISQKGRGSFALRWVSIAGSMAPI
jgi:hypothetical protein